MSAPRILEFRTDGIIVLIDWNQNQYNENVAYIVDVIPQVTVTFINSTSTKLLVSYNIQYNINITAILCGHSSATVTVTLRKFGEFSCYLVNDDNLFVYS